MKLFLTFFISLLFIAKNNAQEVLELPLDQNESAQSSLSKSWHIGLGNYFDMPNTLQNDNVGGKNQLSVWPIINWGRNYLGIMSSRTFLEWNVMVSMPQTVGESDLVRSFLSLDLMAGRNWGSFGELGLGFSFFQQFLFFKSSGATRTESASDSSTFYRPKKFVWLSQETLTAMYRHHIINEHFSLEGKCYIFSLWERKERVESYTLNLLYHW